jgi:sialate O-acetylesterase
MVNPLAPFAMRGAIWYQGESNANGEGIEYHHKKTALINGWRKLFNPDLAFYWVQLANFQSANQDPAGGDQNWAKLREAQRKSLELPHTGMAVIIDIGEAGDIHPKNKQDVGDRLARWALHQTYKKSDVVPSGPLFKGIKVEDGAIRVSFDHVGGGLMVGKKTGLEPTATVADGKLARFAIAGEDKKWHWAEAKIDGDTVVVKSAEVAKPVAVRYAFSMNPDGANLYNKAGLPASPFRSDDW